MNGIKLLADTNVVIGLEDSRPIQASFAELARLCGEHGVHLFIDDVAHFADVNRDRDEARRATTLSKLAKFQQLSGLHLPSEPDLVTRFGPINNDNDRSDVRLLAALDAKAVDILVTQDNGLHRRAERVGLGNNVLTVEDALEWLRQTFSQQVVSLPYVAERKAYQINRKDEIFASLRGDYPGFDGWFDKCCNAHRDCWILELGDQIGGIVIRKEETHAEAGTQHRGPKILKVCTFKVRDEYRGEKFGELLLKQILWFAQRNRFDLVYLTAYPRHAFLVDLLIYYGFQVTQERDGELILEKVIAKGPLPAVVGSPFESDRLHYPRFHDDAAVRKFCVPIQPDYHRRLFPEIAMATELPLFPRDMFGPMLAVDSRQGRTPGNTVRKVYLCRAKINQLRPGDLLFFYMSKDVRYAASQAITTVGVVEQIVEATSADDLISLTAKRSVFSAASLYGMNASVGSAVKVIDFLLAGHIEPFVPLDTLVRDGIFASRPPQSIAELTGAKYAALRPHVKLGFEL